MVVLVVLSSSINVVRPLVYWCTTFSEVNPVSRSERKFTRLLVDNFLRSVVVAFVAAVFLRFGAAAQLIGGRGDRGGEAGDEERDREPHGGDLLLLKVFFSELDIGNKRFLY